MLIAVCDDEQADRDRTMAMIRSYCERKNTQCEIESFGCAEDFLKADKMYDIVFMDIYLGSDSGTDLARECRGRLYRQVVFTTTSTDHAVEAFDLNARPLPCKTIFSGKD